MNRNNGSNGSRALAWLAGVAVAGLATSSAQAARDVEWRQVGGDVHEQRYSPLADVDAGNVQRLGLAWSYEFDNRRGQEATPVVVDGVMYLTSAWSKVYAFDAATGRLLWSYDPKVPGPKAFEACCDVVNRGVAVSRGRVFVGTIDSRLVALDARNGRVLWTAVTADPKQPYSITGAPRMVGDKVVIGNGGGEYGGRGYVTAYDARSGKLRWRFYTVPGDPRAPPDGAASDAALKKLAEPTWFGRWYDYGGGGNVWNGIVYDPEFKQVYIGVGNGLPWDRRVRSEGKGDNLFLASVVALDAETGAYRWHYQVSPGESWDYDNTQDMILATLTIDGRQRPVVMQASKNGYFYVLDRRSGELVSAQNFVYVNWADGIDPKTGRPRVREDAFFYDKAYLVSPGGTGGHNWQPMAFNPGTGLVYIPALEVPFKYGADKDFKFQPGAWNVAVDVAAFMGADDDRGPAQEPGAAPKGELIAWDPVRQKEAWRVQHEWYWNGGVLTTAGNLVFQGEASGAFRAYRADTGAELWSYTAPSGIVAAPMSYRIGGVQYVAVLSGWGGLVLGSTQGPTQRPVPPGRVLVFRLDGQASLPPIVRPVLAPPNPSSEPFSDEQVAAGRQLYARRCAVCHGFGVAGGDILPDLRRAVAVTDKALWQSIVHDGALRHLGMVGFSSYFSPADAEAIRAYVSHQAAQLQASLRATN
ncbi:MAG: PQQ-dependent dehydrogenase, methanol/ethanol family [Steroidobacteraceae bacterium]